jgi:hypothetical protein
MYAIIGLVFCILLGVMTRAQGVAALLWVPLGFAVGLFLSAQMILPLILGLPRAVRLVARRQMRAAVFAQIIAIPVIWSVALFVVGFLWPSGVAFLEKNPALNSCLWLGTIAIVLSPLSRKGRSDFREDFDSSYGRFLYRPTQQKYVDAAVNVASNLYLHTIPGAEDAPAPLSLQFNLPDSRYRYMIFCLSSAITAALAYDEKEEVQPEALTNGCPHFTTWSATEMAHEYFDNVASAQEYVSHATEYLQEFAKHWAQWRTLEKEGKRAEMIDLICSMIHTTESNEPADRTDDQRLRPLALWIADQLPIIREAFVELANR